MKPFSKLEQDVINRYGTKTEGKNFIKAVRKRFRDQEVVNLKPGAVYIKNMVYIYSSFSNTWYSHQLQIKETIKEK